MAETGTSILRDGVLLLGFGLFFVLLFRRLGRDESRLGRAKVVLSYLSTHPMSGDRASRFSGSAVKGETYTPALNPVQWQSLRGICANDPKAKGFELDF